MAELASSFTTSDFDYPLPVERIAQRPLEERDQARLLVARRSDGALKDSAVREIPALLAAGDVLVLNETRVFRARLLGSKPTGAAGEVLLIRPLDADRLRWSALVRPGGKLKPGRVVRVSEDLALEIEDSSDGGGRIVRLLTALPVDEALERYGHVPLPPYIRREDDAQDRERYQTVYARVVGAVAAPTAGLHFTNELLSGLAERGVEIVKLTLHVGPGTFRPVEVEDPELHRVEPEWYRVPRESAERINRARRAGGRVWAVGTTVVRALESVVAPDGQVEAGEGWTDLFIRPGHRFRSVDHLITNFHLPRSTLLMLVAAFAGRDLTAKAYERALQLDYRFYSYGDAMAVI